MTICKIDNCNREIKAKELCLMHYKRLRNGNTPEQMLRPPRTFISRIGSCIHDPCDEKKDSGGYCYLHYHRLRKGSNMDAPPRRKNGEGHINKRGYKIIKWKGKYTTEHRVIKMMNFFIIKQIST